MQVNAATNFGYAYISALLSGYRDILALGAALHLRLLVTDAPGRMDGALMELQDCALPGVSISIHAGPELRSCTAAMENVDILVGTL